MNICVRIPLIAVLLSFQSLTAAQDASVTFHYLGHSSFLIFFDDESSVLTDYGKENAWADYGWDSPIYDIGDFRPDIITYSHYHEDHFDSTRLPANQSFLVAGEKRMIIDNLTIDVIQTSEDTLAIKSNKSYLFEYKGIKVLHMGDCQANIIQVDDPENKEFIQETIPEGCDVLLLPIEGKSKFIPQAEKIISLVKPKSVIPMHYWSNEYKAEFLEYLLKKNKESGTGYEIIHSVEPVYTYSKSDSPDAVKIIDIKPAEFNR